MLILPGTLLRWSSRVLLCLLATSAFGQEDAGKTDNKPARSVVRGRVLFTDSEQPLRRATVRLRKDYNTQFLKRTITGRRGEFSFHGVAAGTYYVDVDARGIVSQTNAVSLTDLGLSIEEASVALVNVDGVNDVRTEVRVTRGGAITGRVAYSDGEPATQARIVLYRQKGQSAAPIFTENWAFTDDRGVYRVEGLPPGDYFVGAVENHAGGVNVLPRDGTGLVTAFHPAALNVSAATVVSVQGSSETRDVNIKFGEEPRRISGTLKWKQSNTAVKQAVVFLRRLGDPQQDLDFRRFMNAVTPSLGSDKTDAIMRDIFFMGLLSTNSPYVEVDDTGQWWFVDLPPGTYSLSAVAPVPATKAARSNESNDDLLDVPDFRRGTLRGTIEVTVKDKNVENLVIDVSEGSSIVGSVVIEGNSNAAVGVMATVTPADLKESLNTPAWVGVDKTFELRSVPPGSVRLDIVEPRGTNYYIRSITGKGVELLNEPMTIAEGEQVAGVQVVLGTDLATVEGRIVRAAGGSVAGGGVVLLPVDQRRWAIPSARGLARADAEGRFSMRLAPGEYFAVAWSLGNEPTVPLESFVRAQMLTARRVSLRPSETRTLEVTAVER